MQANSHKNSAEDFHANLEVTRQLRSLIWLAVFFVGLIQFWAHRNDMNPDGISYLEMGEASIRTGWPALVNGYWSPLYPFLIGVALRVFHPRPEWEFTVVHGLNFAIYLASFACFEVFLREILRATQWGAPAKPNTLPVPGRTLWIWGGVLFLWVSHYWVSAAMVTPDLCVATLVYAATAILLRMYRKRTGWLWQALLGAILGVAYLAKAPMFLLSFVFLVSAFMASRNQKMTVARTALALLVFSLVALPPIVVLSKEKGRWTFGDSGRISYAEYVGGAPKFVYWNGEPRGTGAPLHSPRKLLDAPPIYEFANPIPGSYPLWRDPSYWYDGIQSRFTLAGQLTALYRTASSYLRMISVTGALYAALLAVAYFIKSAKGSVSAIPGTPLVWVPACAAFGLYSLVHVEARFVGEFGLMLLVMVLARVRLPNTVMAAKTSRFTFTVALAPLVAVAFSIGGNARDLNSLKHKEDLNVAQALHAMGVPSGSEVAFIGQGREAYWAHLAGVRIVAEIPEQGAAEVLHADVEKQRRVMKKFAESGAVAVVMKASGSEVSMDGWRRIGTTPYYLYGLQRAQLKD